MSKTKSEQRPVGSPSPADSWASKASMIIPLMLFFILGMLVNTEPLVDDQSINPSAYMGLVAGRVVLMLAAFAWFSREIVRQFPLVIDRWGWIIGVVGAVVWIGICELGIERQILRGLSVSDDWLPAREGVDPFAAYAAGVPLAGFLLARFVLLAFCVPIAEELFLRGFLMRSVEAENWTELPIGKIGRRGVIAATVYAVATHPGEITAAVVWFSMVTALMFRSGKFWNCVVAHGVTNLLLGIYVCYASAWYLW
ncbi:CPBP family glutamic-type intramembrane protease [Roseiconus lacunae]|uniref:CPBP family glutamic-type intramembrane protease n=1 Tax=Roseiconus lacunae TaxID=2605694 RepID=UPI001E31ECF4|nr:CPBP family glutamic-type intramembrane protease [Roseiconus lacunae]MCD0463141.1 CPBP family glutamic-type intramembrane protease [Roseiconus lacunae]